MTAKFLAEMIGTMIILLFGTGVVANVVLSKTKGNNGGFFMITLGWAVGVLLAVYATGPISGAHLNPAVTIGLASIGLFAWAEVPTYIAGQLLGAFIGAVLVYFTYLKQWAETSDPGLKLAVFSTGPEVRSYPANVLTEIIGTFVLVFVGLSIGISKAAVTSGLNPLLWGFLVWGLGVSFGGPTGYAINPARDLGPRIAHFLLPIPGKGSSDWAYSWVPVLGPIIGGVLGAFLYKIVYMG
ncbi:MIP/aquaporin family protein [Desulfosporosinus sp. BICA1-9]|uniref:MIP/aquaporin family protein n=1 Tax=Desulfosporosinus sp. BICA1-9 TaxID=1531958 RepID=UPI00054BDDA3|nr:MIP/aquaporin family protein [Desulfosporosinus sp. BICA1-9]KJS49648.1 MAG: glycerol transporter [Peptococcaceae bacterium BRH_c23]KJS86050.1 MAG: glycerol transporter [Desulfosporosinus sp. BICA1-9]HBW34897.1 aquaporin family protein [Desulfosporosinus sp.]